MRRAVQLLVYAVAFGFAASAVLLAFAVVALLLGRQLPYLGLLQSLVAIVGLAGAAVSTLRAAKRVGDKRLTVADAMLSGLKTIYDRHRLGSVTFEVARDGRYARASETELVDVYSNIKPERAPEAFTQLLLEVRARVLRDYLPDGRRIPARARAAEPVHAPQDARCATHPERPAPLACARCGTFLCAACTSPDGRHCGACLETFFDA